MAKPVVVGSLQIMPPLGYYSDYTECKVILLRWTSRSYCPAIAPGGISQ